MKIKTTLTVAYEAARNNEKHACLTLLGTEALYNEYPDLQRAKITSSTHSFLSIYDLENSFYYRIDRIHNSESIAHEIGVGELVEKDGLILLKRTQPLYVQAVGEERRVAYGTKPINLTTDDLILVTSYIPTNIIEALPDPHMIITSINDHHPHPLKVEENSVVGRLEDTIESIKISDLPCVAPTYANVDEAPKIKGSIIYSEEWDCLKYYNGTEWRSI